MASTPPNPASRSDVDLEIPLGVRVQRQSAIGPAGQPGTIRVVALEGEKTQESEGAAALAALPELLQRAGQLRLDFGRAPLDVFADRFVDHLVDGLVEDAFQDHSNGEIATPALGLDRAVFAPIPLPADSNC